MPEITATDATRNFSDVLDAVEHKGESFTIVRRGRVVARLEPTSQGMGAEVKASLGRHRPDPAWADDLAAVRQLVELEPKR